MQCTIKMVASKNGRVSIIGQDIDDYDPILDVTGEEVLPDEFMLYNTHCDRCGKRITLDDIPLSRFRINKSQKGRRCLCPHCVSNAIESSSSKRKKD